jgi:hypothetical protein
VPIGAAALQVPPDFGSYSSQVARAFWVRQLLLADGGSIELRPTAGTGLDVVVRVRAGRPA